MMKAPERLCVAVRKPDGGILVKNDPFRGLAKRMPFLGWPFLRGPIVLGETLVLGMRALSFSAQQALDEEDEDLSPWAMAATMLFAVGVGIGLFVAAPHLLALWLGTLWPTGFDETNFLFHLIDGVIKVTLFLTYIWLIAFMPDIRRVFEYHGAEHKAIYCYESGGELSVESARGYPRLHPRCGTAFILVVLVISIFIFAGIFPLLPRFSEAAWLNQALQIVLKVFLMLPIAGISYEIIRRAGEHNGRGIWGVLLWPGLQLQRMTTREPDDKQIEIALCALRAAVDTDEAEGSSIKVL